MTLENGHLLKGRYRILDILGQGATGAVYRALDEHLDITVGVKENTVLKGESAQQFQHEAKSLASLRHPSLPRVFEYFEVEGQGQYLIMDYVDGEDLHQWLSDKDGVTEMEALQIGITICNALTFLHTQNPPIMHHDIKPGNIKITPYDEIVLVDFGLEKIQHDQQINTKPSHWLTTGFTPPERYAEGSTDPRSDIFSLGATLYTALTGYLPEDSLARSTGKASLTPLRSYQPHVSRLTAEAIEKALNLHLKDRWQSTEAFSDALIKARDALPNEKRVKTRLSSCDPLDIERRSSARVEPERERLRFFVGIQGIKHGKILDPVWFTFDLVVILLVVVLGFSVLMPQGITNFFNRVNDEMAVETQPTEDIPQTTPDPFAVSPENTPDQPEPTKLAASAVTSAFSPTPTGGGTGVVTFVSERTGTPQIWLIDVASKELTQLTDLADGACQPSWSPDGTRIVFTSPCTAKRASYPGSGLVIIDVDSGELNPLPASLEGDFDPAWSPDGEWIAYTTLINGRSQIAKLSLADLTVTRLSQSSYPDSSPAWSPNGDQLAFVRNRGVDQIWLMDAMGRIKSNSLCQAQLITATRPGSGMGN